MKFLPRALDTSNLMAIRAYYDRGTNDFKTPDDVLYFVYKDIDTGKKYIEEIKHPRVEVYVVKPEYQHIIRQNRNDDKLTYYKNFIKKDYCNKHLVSYKFKDAEIGKVLGCAPNKSKYSPFVFQFDMDIINFSMMQFYIEYGMKNDNKPLKIGMSDIETDIISIDRFPEPGECPINAVSYYDTPSRTMYTLVCLQDNIPFLPIESKRKKYFDELRASFKEQTKYFVEHLEDFKEECKKSFEESYGEINYRIFCFEDEVKFLRAYWEIVRACDPDYLEFWNAPFDVSNLIERCKTLGLDPNEIIADPQIGANAHIKWYEDPNPTTHKRKHIFDLYTKFIVTDQMVNYAGIRSGKGKLESTTLTAIAEKELHDTKLDYSEYGNIRYFPYLDWWKFVLYNIKDVLLQNGIDQKTHDTDYVYNMMSSTCLNYNEIFTSTQVVANDLRLFALLQKDSIMGSNKNKLFRVQKTEEQIKQEKKDKFSGAFVMSPNHCSSTGFMLLGTLNKFIHDHAIDFDIGAEYPTGIQIMNCSNETLVGKVYLKNPEEISIELFPNMWIVDGDDEDIYKKTCDPSVLLVEGLAEDNVMRFGEVYFKLPSFSLIADQIENNIDKFLK